MLSRSVARLMSSNSPRSDSWVKSPPEGASRSRATSRRARPSCMTAPTMASMYNRLRVGLKQSAAVSFLVGFILVLNDSGAGWFLIIGGIGDLAASTRPGQPWQLPLRASYVGGSLQAHYCSSSLSSLLKASRRASRRIGLNLGMGGWDDGREQRFCLP
jgi:hypothetical protein